MSSAPSISVPEVAGNMHAAIGGLKGEKDLLQLRRRPIPRIDCRTLRAPVTEANTVVVVLTVAAATPPR